MDEETRRELIERYKQQSRIISARDRAADEQWRARTAMKFALVLVLAGLLLLLCWYLFGPLQVLSNDIADLFR